MSLHSRRARASCGEWLSDLEVEGARTLGLKWVGAQMQPASWTRPVGLHGEGCAVTVSTSPKGQVRAADGRCRQTRGLEPSRTLGSPA